jgi:hypothetical protein
LCEAKVMEYCLFKRVSQRLLESEHGSEFFFYLVNCNHGGVIVESNNIMNQIWIVDKLNEIFYCLNLQCLLFKTLMKLISSIK